MTTWKQKNHNQDRDGREEVKTHIHMSLGWMDDRGWYQLTTIIKRSYYVSSTHVSRTKHF